jgi:hypothetical protein
MMMEKAVYQKYSLNITTWYNTVTAERLEGKIKK